MSANDCDHIFTFLQKQAYAYHFKTNFDGHANFRVTNDAANFYTLFNLQVNLYNMTRSITFSINHSVHFILNRKLHS